MKMKTPNLATLKAPKISTREREQLTSHKKKLEVGIAASEDGTAKISELRKKEKQFESDSRKFEHAAAAFDTASEIKLLAAQKGLQRIYDAIARAEAEAYDDKHHLWQVIDSAQETVTKLCQPTLNELINMIGVAVSPFYQSLHDASCMVGRNTPATNHLLKTLLRHGASPEDSIERMHEMAIDVLRKIEALLTGGEIWTFEGGSAESDDTAATA